MWEKIKSLLGFADLNKDGKLNLEDLEIAKAVAETQKPPVVEPVAKVKRGRKPK